MMRNPRRTMDDLLAEVLLRQIQVDGYQLRKGRVAGTEALVAINSRSGNRFIAKATGEGPLETAYELMDLICTKIPIDAGATRG